MNSSKNQYLATFCVNFLTLSYGIALGWASPFIPMLLSKDSPLETGAITVNDASWISSIFCIAGAMGSVLYGWLANKIGRKYSIIFCGIPQLISWILLWFRYVYLLYISRFLTGFTAGGIFVLLPLYVTEISEDRIRGILGSVLIVSCNSGVLIGYIVSAYLPYKSFAVFGFICTMVFFIGITFFPETPQYLLNCDKYDNAKKSLAFYRPIEQDPNKPEEFISEIENLKMKSSIEDLTKTEENDKTIKCIPSTIKGILIGTILMLMTQLCGTFAIINYTVAIFEEAGSTLSSNLSAIIVAAIQLIGSYLSTVFVDKLGRRVLLMLSSAGTASGLIILGIYFFLQSKTYDVSSINWLPIICLSLVMFLAPIGIVPLAFVVTSEVLPQNLRSIIPTIFLTVLWIIGFIFVKYFNDLVGVFEMHGFMWFFGICCLFETVFVAVFLPETKGKSFDAITESLS